MPESADYSPIDCSLHDRVEDLAVRGRSVRIVYDADGDVNERDDTIVDWVARDGAEFVRTGSGELIRMDRLIEVDGVKYR